MKQINHGLMFVLLLAGFANSATAQHWRPKHAGLPNGFTAKSVYGDGHSMMVANVNAFTGSQMYYTPDSSTALTGSPSSLGLYTGMESGVVKCVGIHFVAGIGGVFKSHDNGVHWASVGTTGAVASYALYSFQDTLYASMGSGTGVPYISADTGLTWTSIGYTGSLVTAFLKCNGILYAGSTGGLQYTSDYGVTWNAVTAPATLSGQSIVGLTQLGGNVYAACSNGVFKTSDNGHTWSNVLTESMFCITTVDTSLMGGTASHGIFQSDRNGSGWVQVNSGLPPSGGLLQTVNYISYNDDYVIAAVQSDSAIYVTDLSELGLHAPLATKEIKAIATAGISFMATPNPASDEIAIHCLNANSDKVTISLCDMTGRCHTAMTAVACAPIKIALRDIPAGMYLLHIAQNGNHEVHKIIVEK
jgi:hypothetical protein